MSKKSYKGIDYRNVKLITKPKKPTVKDPPRFPSVINPIENKMKAMFNRRMNMAMVDLTKSMVNILKNK